MPEMVKMPCPNAKCRGGLAQNGGVCSKCHGHNCVYVAKRTNADKYAAAKKKATKKKAKKAKKADKKK
jgi:hypothetical protein